MCGIAGFLGRQAEALFDIREMLQVMSARGPDAAGVFQNGRLTFGHARLSIQDVSAAANQPMQTSDGSFVLVFNGEIYNWRQLRRELEERYRFRTERSDAEVLLAGYALEGKAFFSRLEGMFAFAIYDRRQNTLILVRDRIGEKPLYYTWLPDGQIAFASEARALTGAGTGRRAVDQQALYHYLTMLSPPPGMSLFKGVQKLKPGCFLEIRLDRPAEAAEESYWDIADILNRVEDFSYEDILERGEAALAESISLQSQSDTPLAVALSGGLDSSLNLAFAERIRRRGTGGGSKRLCAVNVTRAGTRTSDDEAVIARTFSRDLGVDLLDVTLQDSDFWDEFERLSSAVQDTPVTWPDMVLISAMSRHVRDQSGSKVLLVGEGGDELGAYNSYFDAIDEFQAFEKDGPQAQKWLHSLVDGGRLIPRRLCFGFYEVNKEKFWRGAAPERTTYDIFQDVMQEIRVPGSEGHARRILNLEYKLRLPELLLPRLDYGSMAQSVEARAPFLGRALLEAVLSSRFETRNRGRQAKAWIYDLARRHLPAYITERPKFGFGHEFKTLYNTALKDRFEQEVLGDPDAPLFEYVDRAYAANYFERLRDPSLSGTRIWILYSVNRWLLNL